MSTQAWGLENNGVYNPMTTGPDIRQQLTDILLGRAITDEKLLKQLNLKSLTQQQAMQAALALISQTVSSVIGEDEEDVALDDVSGHGRVGYVISGAVKHNELRAEQRKALERLLGSDDITKYGGVWKR